jgi:hypothetical protein
MTATATTLIDFADEFAAKTNSLDVPDCHPAGAATITHWLDAMRYAAEQGQPARVAELARMVTDKVALERRWHAESMASARRRPA